MKKTLTLALAFLCVAFAAPQADADGVKIDPKRKAAVHKAAAHKAYKSSQAGQEAQMRAARQKNHKSKAGKKGG